MYCILVVDLDECYCADVYSDGEVNKLFTDVSLVPHKMGVGGQSAHRFAQIRQNEIVLWFKSINEMLKTVNDKDIILGINHVYERRFLSYLNTYNKNKISKIISNEYSGLEGIYDTINRLENDKIRYSGKQIRVDSGRSES